MTLFLLIFACLAVLADAWATRACLLLYMIEWNRLRLFFIRLLGINGGTFGVAMAGCVALIASYVAASSSPYAGITYAAVASIFTYVAFNNYRRAKAG